MGFALTVILFIADRRGVPLERNMPSKSRLFRKERDRVSDIARHVRVKRSRNGARVKIRTTTLEEDMNTGMSVGDTFARSGDPGQRVESRRETPKVEVSYAWSLGDLPFLVGGAGGPEANRVSDVRLLIVKNVYDNFVTCSAVVNWSATTANGREAEIILSFDLALQRPDGTFDQLPLLQFPQRVSIPCHPTGPGQRVTDYPQQYVPTAGDMWCRFAPMSHLYWRTC